MEEEDLVEYAEGLLVYPLRRCSVHDVGFGITGAKVIVEQILM